VTTYLTACEQRVIDLAHGAVDYLEVDVEDAWRQNLTAAPISLTLGTYDTPGTWHPVDTVIQNGQVWQVRVSLLIGTTVIFPAGTYWVWTKVGLPPETVIHRATNKLVTVTGVTGSGLYGFGLYGSGLYGG